MQKLPPHIQTYVQTSPYGPFNRRELNWLAGRLAQHYPHPTEEDAERELLAHRAALDPTPRNLAIFNNAISTREKAKGRHLLAVICPCGSRDVHYDVNGPDPMQQFCDDCNEPVSHEHIRQVIEAKLKEMGRNVRQKFVN